MTATIYCLLFGDHHRLHARLLRSLQQHVPRGEAKVIVWCNQVCKRTVDFFARRDWPASWRVILNDANIPKYHAMSEMFYIVHPPQTEWIVWFDDDSYIAKHDWWVKTKAYLTEKKSENIAYVGQPWFVHNLPGQLEFIQQASWYKGLPPQMCPTKKKGVMRPGIWFAQGAYWLLRTDVLRLLHWPDPRLKHNGGDTLLGEAVRQQGLPFHRRHYGVVINNAPRRGYHEAPAGVRDKSVRR